MVEETTTVQVTYETWAAMDKRKDAEETFDDFIQRLIDNTSMPMGALDNVADTPTAITGEVSKIETSEVDRGCAHFDAIEGMCENEVAYKQEYRMQNTEAWDAWYWCEEHAPEVEEQ